MTEQEYIRKFAEKHGTVFYAYADTEETIVKFRNGMFFEITDICIDIDRKLPVWAAKEYDREGTWGIVTLNYSDWYELRKTDFTEEV